MEWVKKKVVKLLWSDQQCLNFINSVAEKKMKLYIRCKVTICSPTPCKNNLFRAAELSLKCFDFCIKCYRSIAQYMSVYMFCCDKQPLCLCRSGAEQCPLFKRNIDFISDNSALFRQASFPASTAIFLAARTTEKDAAMWPCPLPTAIWRHCQIQPDFSD